MVLSWALTEVVRYTFYAATLFGWEPALLVWTRYSTFFVLYPTGAGSEALVNFATLPCPSRAVGLGFRHCRSRSGMPMRFSVACFSSRGGRVCIRCTRI
ncbi:tyrosine phosphatase-like protein [Lactifluus volemus]|nr:tyrosine phosphatase-like protein [Lactifluus volemus]